MRVLWISVFMCKLTHSRFPFLLPWLSQAVTPTSSLQIDYANSSDSVFSSVHQLLNPSAVTLLGSLWPSHICSPHHATVLALLCISSPLYSLSAASWRADSALMSPTLLLCQISWLSFMPCLRDWWEYFCMSASGLVLDASGRDGSAPVLCLFDGEGGASFWVGSFV